MLASIPEIDGGLIALTRFQGDIGFYPEEYLEIIRMYMGFKISLIETFLWEVGCSPPFTLSGNTMVTLEPFFASLERGSIWNCGQIINHDSEDYEHLVDLGTTDRGDPVLMNKYVYDSDVAILIGHTQGNPYGGYSGGYKHCATGITHWRSIANIRCR